MWAERKAECARGEDPVRYNVFLVSGEFRFPLQTMTGRTRSLTR